MSIAGLLLAVGIAAAPAAGVADAGVDDRRLRAILRARWDAALRDAPEWATSLGDHRFDGKVGDRSVAAAARRVEEAAEALRRLEQLERDGLSDRDAMFADLLGAALRSEIEVGACRFETWQVSPRMNTVVDLFDTLGQQPLESSADARRWVARAEAWSAGMSVHVAALREGAAAGRVASATSLGLVVAQVSDVLATDVSTWPPLQRQLSGPRADDHRAMAIEVLERAVRPAAEAWLAVVRDELVPLGRSDDAPGVAGMPDADVCYAALIRRYTTLPRSADALHELGLAELSRIHTEMVTAGREALGISELPALFARLREDPALRFTTEGEVRDAAERALRRAEAAVPAVFGRLPATRCVVSEVPEHEAPYTTIAYYRQPNPDGSKPGEYVINTWAPTTRPRHEAEALAFHESVPGHHLQIALSYEAAQVPAFVRYDGATAFVEGWALYSERLADELGLYSSDLDRLGMMSFDTWRAARLVVDTGLHHKGWSREQAVRFMLENTPLAENNIRNEVDRYVTWPGQALAYKVGQVEILALRRGAEARLGEAFDLSAFHDVVLAEGAVTLPVLADRIAAWVEARARSDLPPAAPR